MGKSRYSPLEAVADLLFDWRYHYEIDPVSEREIAAQIFELLGSDKSGASSASPKPSSKTPKARR
jgi:hypothetical protein